MAKETKQQIALDEALVENASKTEKFFSKHQKLITWVAVIVIVIVGGYFVNKHFFELPKQEKASAEMFVAIQHFNAQEYQVALEGDGNYAGFLDIVEEYDGTPQASLAAHYAGVCYYNLGDSLRSEALNYLAKYEAASGAPAEVINAQNLGLQADIYANNGDLAKAAELYREAIDACKANALTTPIYLKKLGLVEEALGNNEAALEAFQKAYEEYGLREVESFIGRLQ